MFANETIRPSTTQTKETLADHAGPLNQNPHADAGEEPQEGEELVNTPEDSTKQFNIMPDGNPQTLPESSSNIQLETSFNTTSCLRVVKECLSNSLK